MMLRPNEMIIDSFAGGGGASTAIEMAFGRSPDIAINHDPEAIAMHAANHPLTRHYCQSIYQVDPDDIVREYKRRIGFAWFSPDCTHHSKARGGKPKMKHMRDLAWVVVHWAERADIRVMGVENVEEFQDWGPLLDDGTADPDRKGEEFNRWVNALRRLGYKVEWRQIRACDYGAPTIRKRLFIIARKDGLPIVWPKATHGNGQTPYRTAAECIDWSIPCPSIFERRKPLAENTLRRIARGIDRYVINSRSPFIVKVNHGYDQFRGQSIDDPLQTVTGSNGYGLVAPTVTRIGQTGGGGLYANRPDDPLTTITTKADHLLVAPLLAASSGPAYSAKPRSVEKPIHTITADTRAGMVTAFLTKHFGGNESPGWPLERPISTVTAVDHHAVVTAHVQREFGASIGHSADAPLGTITAGGAGKSSIVTSHLLKMRNNCFGQSIEQPLDTITGVGGHFAEVRAFLLKYYGNEREGHSLADPIGTVTSKDRFGLVTIEGEDFAIVDIGMRMLTPRELYRAQGFPTGYIIDPIYKGKPLTKTAQVRMCGNSVSPPPAAALIRAQFEIEDEEYHETPLWVAPAASKLSSLQGAFL